MDSRPVSWFGVTFFRGNDDLKVVSVIFVPMTVWKLYGLPFIPMTVLPGDQKEGTQKYRITSLIQQPLGNDLPHHLRAAGGNGPQAVVSGEALDGQFTHISEAAVHLDRLVGDAIRHLS